MTEVDRIRRAVARDQLELALDRMRAYPAFAATLQPGWKQRDVHRLHAVLVERIDVWLKIVRLSS